MIHAVLDTSVVVRYLIGDDPASADAARTYLTRARVRSLLMPDVAVAELAFVLLRVYRWPASSAADAVRAVVNHRAIEVPGRDLWLEVAGDLERGYGPVDAYLLRTAERDALPGLITLDEGIHPLATVECVAPPSPPRDA
ncbi:MAG: PIN domain-containing protein [Chloroflexota bacterium]